MFGDMMGQMQDMQAQLKEKLKEIIVTAEAGDGLVKVEANAAREIINVSIDASLCKDGDNEAIEDMVMIAINRALEKAAETEAAESQSLVQNMLPPGLGGMFGG